MTIQYFFHVINFSQEQCFVGSFLHSGIVFVFQNDKNEMIAT